MQRNNNTETRNNEKILIENSFENYFLQFVHKQKDEKTVIGDNQRWIVNQSSIINGLSSTEIDVNLKVDEKIPSNAFFGFTETIKNYFSSYRHQGDYAAITHTYYFIRLQEKGFLIPSGFNVDNKENVNANKSHYMQIDGSVIYIEKFDIPYYQEMDLLETLVTPHKSNIPIAKLVTVSILTPGEDGVTHDLLLHKIFVMDEKTGSRLFDKNDSHIEKCYMKSKEEVEAIIAELLLPYKLYGLLNTINQNLKNPILMPHFLKNPDWKKVISNLNHLFYVDWISFYDSLQKIDWSEFENNLIANHTHKHYEIVKSKLIPISLPKDVTPENFALQIASERIQKDIQGIKKEFNTIMEKIVIPNKNICEYNDKTISFENQCSILALLCNKKDEPNVELMQAGTSLYNVLNKIIKTLYEKKNQLALEELTNLTKLATDSIELITNFQMDISLISVDEESNIWSTETCKQKILNYENSLKTFAGKYKTSTFLSKFATFTGSVVTTFGTVGSAGLIAEEIAVPAVVGSTLSTISASTLTLFAAPIVVGVALTGVGVYVLNDSQKGEVFKAGQKVLQEFKKCHLAMDNSEKKTLNKCKY